MAKNTIADLDTTASNNTDILGQSTQGSAAVSTVDSMIQNTLGMLARFYSDVGGLGTVGGTGDAITLTSLSTYQALENGLVVALKASAANTGATTLNVDSLGAKAVRLSGDTALVGGEILEDGIYLFRYDTAYASAAGAWVLLNPSISSATTSQAGIVEQQFNAVYNIGLACSVGASALTIALKDAEGNDPSSSSPVIIPFRNATAATGTPSYLTVTAATSLVISSGSTLGFTSGSIGRLWIVGFNDGGTFRLGAVNCLSGTSIMALRNGIYSSTAEGGAGGADSAQVIYTGTAVTSKAMTILGYLEATEATAGTWATAPSLVKVLQPGDALPGDVVQVQRTDTGAVATGTTTVPVDDTIPQSTEGDQYMSQAITPLSGANVLLVETQVVYQHSTGNFTSHSIFRDSTANALKTSVTYIAAAGGTAVGHVSVATLASSTSATTMKLRSGPNAASTITFNGSAGTRWFGGVANSYISVKEVVA